MSNRFIDINSSEICNGRYEITPHDINEISRSIDMVKKYNEKASKRLYEASSLISKMGDPFDWKSLHGKSGVMSVGESDGYKCLMFHSSDDNHYVLKMEKDDAQTL